MRKKESKVIIKKVKNEFIGGENYSIIEALEDQSERNIKTNGNTVYAVHSNRKLLKKQTIEI